MREGGHISSAFVLLSFFSEYFIKSFIHSERLTPFSFAACCAPSLSHVGRIIAIRDESLLVCIIVLALIDCRGIIIPMKINKAYKFRIYPTKPQMKQLSGMA